MDVTTYLIFAALILIPLWKIFDKAGLSPGFALLMLIPYVGQVIVLLILAFDNWPNVGTDGSAPSPTSIEAYDHQDR